MGLSPKDTGTHISSICSALSMSFKPTFSLLTAEPLRLPTFLLLDMSLKSPTILTLTFLSLPPTMSPGHTQAAKEVGKCSLYSGPLG